MRIILEWMVVNGFAIYIWFEIYFEFIPGVMSVAQYWFYILLKLH